MRSIVPCVFLAASVCGCTSSAEKSLEKTLKQAGLSRETVFPFAGTVTIDGRPPGEDGAIVVMLNDPQSPNVPLDERRYVECDADGKFLFSTYTRGDGAPGPRTYVVTFARLRKSSEQLLGPDQLGNRYNDPDKNAQIAEFKIEHKSPGKSDYAFDLKTEGVEPGTPGPHSLTQL